MEVKMENTSKQKTESSPNHIELIDRKMLKATGVTEAISATETQILLKTDFGPLLITGSALHVENLNKTEKVVELTGEINEVKYTKSKKNFFQKLFK